MQKVGNGSDADQCHSISRREERNHNLIKFKEVNKVSIMVELKYTWCMWTQGLEYTYTMWMERLEYTLPRLFCSWQESNVDGSA